MINRREFGGALGIAAQGIPNNSLANSLAAEQKPQGNALMHVGGDYHNIVGGDITSKQNLEYNLRHGVNYLTAELSKNPQGAWDPGELQRMKDTCDKYGVVFEAIRMNSGYINKLRNGPERDRQIDIIVGNIRKAAQIGVQIITYHCEVIPYRRNGKTTGRGGVLPQLEMEKAFVR
jgi:D-mannonate dehydratase (UxuA)